MTKSMPLSLKTIGTAIGITVVVVGFISSVAITMLRAEETNEWAKEHKKDYYNLREVVLEQRALNKQNVAMITRQETTDASIALILRELKDERP